MARTDGADRARSLAWTAAAGRSPRREHVGARGPCRTRGPLRYGRRRRRLRANGARWIERRVDARTAGDARALRSEIGSARQLTGARVGHDADDVLVRHAALAAR